ncbi:type II toxin-antitoxin system Phd/YefM family antitoxin [Paracoccus sp. MC1862]|nr:type II toxin-antitoxin system Phd/YefM family antitoxin [Paracoccus sp. MC1862]MBB1498927.1 type II toxin-antitoxin system Phd/YefM family antitoxin [Paracoccus sp. MC1862]QQO46725.1 type II toxin-antitoxin system Phd/YefM family antitoxin [Paracoccus sp. MC1862]
MTITTLSSRELNQDIGRAKKAAMHGPVVITDRGRPAHVLLTFAQYQRLTGQQRSLAEALAMPGLSDIPLDPPRADIRSRVPDLS